MNLILFRNPNSFTVYLKIQLQEIIDPVANNEEIKYNSRLMQWHEFVFSEKTGETPAASYRILDDVVAVFFVMLIICFSSRCLVVNHGHFM